MICIVKEFIEFSVRKNLEYSVQDVEILKNNYLLGTLFFIS